MSARSTGSKFRRWVEFANLRSSFRKLCSNSHFGNIIAHLTLFSARVAKLPNEKIQRHLVDCEKLHIGSRRHWTS